MKVAAKTHAKWRPGCAQGLGSLTEAATAKFVLYEESGAKEASGDRSGDYSLCGGGRREIGSAGEGYLGDR